MPNALRAASRTRLFVTLLCLSLAFLITYQFYFATRVEAVSTSVVISQIYGGGGNTGAQYQNDFVELFNRGNSTVSLTGWSVGYASATGTGNFATAPISGSIAPGQYYLVKLGPNSLVGAPLPAPDTNGPTGINMSGTAGKVVVATTTTLACNGGSTPCSAAQLAQIVDLVGYGSANFFEGAPAPTLSNTTAGLRDAVGCTDTDNNGADFSSVSAPVSPGAPAPRNTASALHPCTAGNNPPSINAPANPIATKNQDDPPFTVNLSGSDDGGVYSWGATGGTGISSVVVSGGQGTATVTYTVTLQSGFAGTATFTASLSDNVNAPATRVVNIAVNGVVPPAAVVISQVYGGGGNAGATLRNDFIELINHSASPVSLNGWSVQVFSEEDSVWEVTPLTNIELQPGQYYLVQESQGAGGTQNLPTPDASGTIRVPSDDGKVALVSNVTPLSGTCPTGSGIADFVGYGSVDCKEGSATAPELSNTTADLRRNNGCFDTNQNALDFLLGDPNPRNSSSPFNLCTGLSGYGSANPSSLLPGDTTTLTVYVAPAQNPGSTGITVTANLSQIGGSPTQAFAGGPNTFTYTATVPANNPTGMKSLPVTIADAQSRSASTNIVLSVLPLIADHVTISQLYGGGGNASATYNHDFVELYNPTTSTFDLTTWSLQYSSATGESWQVQPLGGAIGPGEYYLIGLATNNSSIGTPLPPANVDGDINMAGAAGKIALVSNFDPLVGACPIGDPGIVDFVGYGTTANCAEGVRAAAPSNTTALLRKSDGERDSDHNLNDFVTGVPNPNRRTAPIVEIGPSVFGTDPRNNATTAPRDATISINFTEPVTVDEGWYNIQCNSTGNHNSATVRSFFGGDTYTITPNVNFAAGEQCTVTIFRSAIHDVDTDDPAPNGDSLPADKIFTFTVATGTAPPYDSSVHLTMGNPGGITPASDNNYLMEKPEFTLSYNRSRGTANWVSWHLSDEWIGTLTRVDTFRADPEIPADWFRVSGFDYVNSGFDRGHMVPNADRDKETSIPINQATFLMTNIIPQTPDNNQGPWADLENEFRTLLNTNEIYIVAGGSGTGGTIGTTTPVVVNAIAGGNVTVPSQTWKVALILPKDSGDDVSRVTCSTRTLAVIMPNIQGIRNNPWENYITTVDAVETLTGYDFFSNLPDAVENCVEAGTNGANSPATANQSASTLEDTPVEITLQAVRPNTNPLTFSIVSGPTNGSLGSIGSTSCTDFACSATVTYTPGLNYDGADSFTFRASQGTTNSNISTVSITISPDEDGDGVVDGADNCPTVANADQADFDNDGIGNACDADDDNDGQSDADEIACGSDPLNATSNATDTDADNQPDCVDTDDDNDGVLDGADNCPLAANADQADGDGDGIGNACDPTPNDGPTGDLDGDGVVNNADNCPLTSNTAQTDTDVDGAGDACDADDDGDGVLDAADNCPLTSNSAQTDTDADGAGDACDADDDNDGVLDGADNCPLTSNTAQTDTDADGAGDACDADDDNDGVLDGADNCPLTSNTAQTDTDADGAGDACDADDDNDGVLDGADNCPLTSNTAQTDTDADGAGDACDADDDNDGVLDGADNCPLTSNTAQTDTDADGAGDACDADDDNDGVLDGVDNCPLTANVGQADNDQDGLGDVCDPDDDNDGVLDGGDNCSFTANTDQADFDQDGIGNACDPDDDNDNVADGNDLCPNTPPNTQVNAAGCPDADGDGVADTADNCKFVANADQTDTDGDGFGDSCDLDDDNDTVLDGDDNCPLSANPLQEDFDLDGAGDVCDPITGPPVNKDQCKDGGWERFTSPTFTNQGQCLAYVNALPQP